MTTTRRTDIDWLRAVAMGMIFLFHNARFFDEGSWHVRNGTLSFAASVFVGVVAQWIMPLFFVLSAISVCYALDRRPNPQFVAERCRRLLVPLLFGTLILVPPKVYIERVTQFGYAALRAINTRCWLTAIFGFARHQLQFPSKVLKVANTAVLPFYILHQSVVVVSAYFLIDWQATTPIKYPVLAAASFGVILTLYELAIRRVGALRFLFGMK